MELWNKKFVYKVVVPDKKDGVFLSAWVGNSPSWHLLYQIGKMTTPKIGKIFCFTSKKAALSWCDGYISNGVILKCKVRGTQRNVTAIPTFRTVDNEGIINFWEQGTLPTIIYDQQTIPKGTILCNAVLPIAICEEKE